jgi:hypothetical protein
LLIAISFDEWIEASQRHEDSSRLWGLAVRRSLHPRGCVEFIVKAAVRQIQPGHHVPARTWSVAPVTIIKEFFLDVDRASSAFRSSHVYVRGLRSCLGRPPETF